MIETDALNFEDMKKSFDRTFQEPLVEREQELVHLLIVRIGTPRFALRVADLAGLARAPDRSTYPRREFRTAWPGRSQRPDGGDLQSGRNDRQSGS